MHNSEQGNSQRTSENGKRTFEPKPQKIDIDTLGSWLLERDRKVLDMLEEYDRRHERRKARER